MLFTLQTEFFRSGRFELFCEKAVLEMFTKFTGKQMELSFSEADVGLKAEHLETVASEVYL